MNNNLDFLDYSLIIGGVLLLPVFLIGLIPIGIGVWRIGDKMQKHKKETDDELDRKYGTSNSYSEDTLREMK